MADALTSDYDFTKPEVGGSDDTWGDKLNANWELVDDILTSAFTPPEPADATSGILKAAVLPATASVTGTWTFASATVTGSTSLATVGSSGLATLNSLSVTTTSTLTGDAAVGAAGVWSLSHTATNQSVILSGGSTSALGARLSLNGESHANAGDFTLYDSATAVIDYDASGGTLDLLDFVVGAAGVSINAAANDFNISRDDTAKQLSLSGGSGAGNSAELVLHGSTDINGNDYEFKIAGVSAYHYDHDALSHTFKTGVANTHLVTGVGSAVFGNATTTQFNILRSGNAEILGLFGGGVAENGGGLKLWGSGHAVGPDFALMSAANNIIQYDSDGIQLNISVGTTTQARLTANNMQVGNNGTQNYTISRAGTADQLNLSGGNGPSDGGNIQLKGSTSTDPGDILFRADATVVGQWDESQNRWSFTCNTIDIGAAYSSTAASNGHTRISSGELRSSRSEAGTNTHYRFYDDSGGSAGTIQTDGSGNTAYNTTSDERLKTDFRAFDGLALLRKMNMYHYARLSDGKRGYGPRAQELNMVFPDAVSVGGEDPRQDPWGYDASKIVPLLVKAVQQLEERLDAIH